MPRLRQLFHSYFSVIDRYLLREFALSLLAVTSVLWLIFIATRFSRIIAQAAVGNLPSEVVLPLLGYSSLGALSLLLPISAFLGAMLTLGRMNSDNELTVMAACGIPERQLVKNVLIFSGSVAIIVAFLSLEFVPAARTQANELEQNAKIAADTTGLIAGNFKESQDGNWTFYSEGLTEDKQGMNNVFIEIHNSKRPTVFRAKQAHFEIDPENGNKYLILENGYRYQGEAGDQDIVIAQFKSHSVLIEEGGKQYIAKQKALPSSVLWQRGNKQDLAELQWRVSVAIMTILLCLLAIKLASTGPRKGRYSGFLPAIVMYVIYSNLLGVTRAWVEKGIIAPWFGAVWVHLLLIGVLLILFYKQSLRRIWLEHQQVKGAMK